MSVSDTKASGNIFEKEMEDEEMENKDFTDDGKYICCQEHFTTSRP